MSIILSITKIISISKMLKIKIKVNKCLNFKNKKHPLQIKNIKIFNKKEKANKE